MNQLEEKLNTYMHTTYAQWMLYHQTHLESGEKVRLFPYSPFSHSHHLQGPQLCENIQNIEPQIAEADATL